MKNVVKKAIVALGVSLVLALGTSEVSASYNLTPSDEIKVKVTANNISRSFGSNYCSDSRYNNYIEKLNTYADYFDRNSRDYIFSKSIARELTKKCAVSINTNNSNFAANCGYNGCGNNNQNNNYQNNNNSCVNNDCTNNNYVDYNTYYDNNRQVHNNRHTYNNGCQYNGCNQHRNYKKGYYVTKKNGIEIRKNWDTMYLYDGLRLILTYELSKYENRNFSIEYFNGNRNIFVISKADKYGKCVKWIYNRTTNTIAKINIDSISKIKKDAYGNYYFVAKKDNRTILYKYNCRSIVEKHSGLDIVDYTVYRNGCIKLDYYNSYGYLVSKYIR